MYAHPPLPNVLEGRIDSDDALRDLPVPNRAVLSFTNPVNLQFWVLPGELCSGAVIAYSTATVFTDRLQSGPDPAPICIFFRDFGFRLKINSTTRIKVFSATNGSQTRERCTPACTFILQEPAWIVVEEPPPLLTFSVQPLIAVDDRIACGRDFLPVWTE
jgi:hypothetical protein